MLAQSFENDRARLFLIFWLKSSDRYHHHITFVRLSPRTRHSFFELVASKATSAEQIGDRDGNVRKCKRRPRHATIHFEIYFVPALLMLAKHSNQCVSLLLHPEFRHSR